MFYDVIQRKVSVIERREVCTIRFEPVIETVENSMLTHQRLHRGKLKGNSGTAHIFWYMMDEDVHF